MIRYVLLTFQPNAYVKLHTKNLTFRTCQN